MLKAVAFDFDGVLFESVDVKTRAFQALFRDESPASIAAITTYHLENGGINRWDKISSIHKNILKRPLSQERLDQLAERFAALVVQEVVEAPWVAGAREFLDKFQERLAYFVISATPDFEIKEIVQRKAIGRYFTEVLGAPRKKDVLLKEIMERHGLSPVEIVYVGDAINDWHAAQRVTVPFVWRRASPDISMLPDYQGPWISTLLELEREISL